MKRVFGTVEIIFDIAYLLFGLIICILFLNKEVSLSGFAAIMTLVLIVGDAFHLIPRIMVILTKDEPRFRKSLGIGKLVTSLTMTVFYILLFRILVQRLQIDVAPWVEYVIIGLALVRIALCLFPQNEWTQRFPPVNWAVYRNIPFFILGMVVAVEFFVYRNAIAGMQWIWLAILLSYAFYLPVVLFSNKNPKVGMLMLPKTCMYVWIMMMCLKFV
ncbi:MAG: hypothetical protein Q4D65_07190 [Peptostreptococcaceae bacterium]|nr:hypothetical protein [Peptostreptococcaceae bacterium]